MTAMEFGLLGPLVVRCGGRVVPVRRGKQRALLAALLLDANRVVSTDRMAEVLWGAAQPPSALVTIRNYVKRLRQALGGDGAARICAQPRGYLIQIEPDELDVSRFEALLRSARSAACGAAWDEAAAGARAALALWRGEPLADVESELLALQHVPLLAELQLQALETRIDAELRLGRHADVVTELQQLAAAHPLREQVHALLMLALYRDCRQGEALAAYRRARTVLREELGIEPGANLQHLHQQILCADPTLAAPRLRVSAATTTAPAALTPADGTTISATPPADTTATAAAAAPEADAAVAAWRTQGVPRQLPGTILHFAGRAAELAALTQVLDQAGGSASGTVVISAIGGTAGVGKTALAVHWAHRVARRFPGGQLYMNLRGFDPSATPVTPGEAIRGFLDALGVPVDRVPRDLAAQAGLYRSVLAGSQVLIVLDNARDEQQVRPLLPAGPGCLVLVTSRSQLAGLAAADGALLLSLDLPSQAEARQMLTARVGASRAAAEPDAVTEIIELCSRLPLALAVAAARASTRPGQPLSALAAELRDGGGRIDVLDTGDPGSSMRAVFSWSTRQLTGQAARMFGLLGIHPGPDISVPAAASLAGIAEAEARRLLGELARAHLTAEHLLGRYAFHDLLRAYAAEQARRTGSEPGPAAAGRVLDHYLHTAAHAARLLDPTKEPVALAPPRPGALPEQPADRRQALAWFEAEHQVLLAAVALAAGSGFDTHAWQLPSAMTPFFHARGHWQEWAATQRTALAAATRLGDAAGQALSGRLLAMACTQLGDHDQARGHFATSLTAYQGLGNRLGQARIHQSLGVLAGRQGRYADALGHAGQALRLCQAIGDKAGEAGALNNAGWYHGMLGDYQQARAFCRQALTLSAEAGHRWREGHAWDSLGYAEHHLGNLAEAAACYQRALSLFRESGDRFYEAEALTHFGDARHAAGELAQTRESWQQALAILEDLQHPDVGQVRARLASITSPGHLESPGTGHEAAQSPAGPRGEELPVAGPGGKGG
jgi:DNA-binding SARP family transcriptional activator/tetratricopeptide (TPR) repeat protein